MMMDSGVLRPGDRSIRRGPDGVPLYASGQVSDFLNHSLDVLFGPESKPPQQKAARIILRSQAGKLSPPQATPSRFSLKGLLIWLGVLDEAIGGGPRPPLSPPQPLLTELETRVDKLESLLKAEQALCQAQREELLKLRDQVKKIGILEAELEIERDSSRQLVHWLQDAEQVLARHRAS